MNKDQFIKAIAAQAEAPQKQVNKIISAAFDIIQNSVADGDSVDITGFGSFASTELKAREGINPQTKEKIDIAARIAPKFKPGKTFKDLVAGKK
jgi:DNA-binding protein HU-beta